eukprot:COSAG06_NODE_6333_length_2975_cov_6.838542_3_plen_48_part_00
MRTVGHGLRALAHESADPLALLTHERLTWQHYAIYRRLRERLSAISF